MRRITKKINCGGVFIGGDSHISIQSMTNTPTADIKTTVAQIRKLCDAGCEIVRCSVPDMQSAEALKNIRKQIKIPLVADIHFDYRLAIEAIRNGADKIRINPGNIGNSERVRSVVNTAKEYKIPIRIGVNSGSVEKSIIEKFGGVTAEGIVESALNNIKMLEDMGHENIVVSIKSSDVVMNYAAHKLISDKMSYPLHIGVTESGTPEGGIIKSAVGIGSLLLEGIGDTIRVSLTGDPVCEITVARQILKSIGLMRGGINLVSCPTCARTKVDLTELASAVEKRLAPIEADLVKSGSDGITVAVMGCAVNGPGEAVNADWGIACGDGNGLLFKKGMILKKLNEEELEDALIEAIKASVTAV